MSAECRKTPCPSCPYRRDVPSGVWDASEYEKLRTYDLPLPLQPAGPFSCHQPTEGGETLCAGWVHTHGGDLLSLRIGIATGKVAGSVIDVIEAGTTVPLFPSGNEAADHGLREVDDPSDEAIALVEKILRLRESIDWTPPENVR